MVGKLIKHDLIALFRLLLFIGCFALGFAILSRIFMTTGSSFWLFMFIMSLWASIALMFVASIGSIVRFYKSLFTGQGYMTFSLPVSVTKLLIAKLLSAIIDVGFARRTIAKLFGWCEDVVRKHRRNALLRSVNFD